MRTLRLAGAEIDLHDSGLTVTRYADEGEVPAYPEDTDAYRLRSYELGYGGDTARMSREHELGHAILAALLGLPHSPTLHGVATGQHAPDWYIEEAAVLALQRWARARSVDLVSVAERVGRLAP